MQQIRFGTLATLNCALIVLSSHTLNAQTNTKPIMQPEQQPETKANAEAGHGSESHGGPKNADGSWKYTNSLADASSPYLLQHAHNPVDWHPWGREAIELARTTGKPIFLSVGYSTCYWCHVMEREVFVNETIAEQMNEQFVNIKVDREERPDIDQIYMTATQIMTGRGGWPNSVFLTHDLLPFYAGTYFGPTDQQGRPGFPTILAGMHDAWKNKKTEVDSVAADMAQRIQTILASTPVAAPTPNAASFQTQAAELLDTAASQEMQSYDNINGGFGQSPKFPNELNLLLLLEHYERTHNTTSLDAVTYSLHEILKGGIHDHVGGGFHRYAVDRLWQVPHFEKMLYTQAMLLRVLSQSYEYTNDVVFKRAADRIVAYLDKEMTSPHGAFYSALDAETHAVEGATYTWTIEQTREAFLANDISSSDIALFDRVFAYADVPIFPGHLHPEGGVVYMQTSVADAATQAGITEAQATHTLDLMLSVLHTQRAHRDMPRLDDKVLASWNGQMIASLAIASRVYEDPTLADRGARAMRFILNNMRTKDGGLYRSWRNGTAGQPAALEDAAHILVALVELYRATGDAVWLDDARTLDAWTTRTFFDEATGRWFTAQDSEYLIVRASNATDSAMPGAAAVLAHAFVGLHEITQNDVYSNRAEALFSAYMPNMQQVPALHSHLIRAMSDWAQLTENQSTPNETNTNTDNIENAQTNTMTLILDTREDAPEPMGHESASVVDVSLHLGSFTPAADTEAGGLMSLRIELAIQDHWHINANETSLPTLIPTQVDVRSETPIAIEFVGYPKATQLETGMVDEPIDVYDGMAVILVDVRLSDEPAPGSMIPMRAIVDFQACDEGQCLMPTSMVIPFHVRMPK